MYNGFSFYSASLSNFSTMLQPLIPPVESPNPVSSATEGDTCVPSRELLLNEVTRLFDKQEYYRSAYNEVVQRLTVLSSVIPEFAFDSQLIEPEMPGNDEVSGVELDEELVDFMMVTLRHREERDRAKARETISTKSLVNAAPPKHSKNSQRLLKCPYETEILYHYDYVSPCRTAPFWPYLPLRVMGVRGLSSYLQRDDRNFECVQLHHTDVVIDAHNFLYYIYLKSSLYTQFGGENFGFCELITRTVRLFQRCDIKPIFVFDGCHEESKLNTQISRSYVRLQTCRNFVKNVSTNKGDAAQSPVFRIPIVPQSAPLLLAQTLKLLNVEFVVADRECDLPAVSLAACLRCPVISNDSDFYISVPTPDSGVSYLPLSLISLKPVVMDSRCVDCQGGTSQMDQGCCAYLSCSKFIITGPGFRNLPPAQRPLFASLLGNDHVPPNAFLSYLPVSQGLCKNLGKSASKVMRQGRRKTLFDTLINWLSGFGNNQKEPVKRILARCPKARVEILKKMLTYSMATYEVDIMGLGQTLQSFLTPTSTGIPDECDSLDEIDSLTFELDSMHVESSPEDDSSSSCSEFQGEEDIVVKVAEEGPRAAPSQSTPDQPDVSVEFTQNWPERLVFAFRKCLLFPCFLDAVYARGLVLNCGVEALNDCKSIYYCASTIRQLFYNVLLGVEQSCNGRLPSDFPGVFHTSSRFTVLEFFRRGSSKIRKCKVQVSAMPLSALPFSDRRIVFLQDRLVSEYNPRGFVEPLALLASLWFVNEPALAGGDIPSSPMLLALGAIAASTHTFQEHFSMVRLKMQRKYMHHLANCTKHFSSTVFGKRSESRIGQRALRLPTVHAFGQLDAVYAALTSLGALLDCLADDTERERLPCCIALQPLSVILPSGCLFHFIVQFLMSVASSDRLATVIEVIIPKLVFTTSEENRQTMVPRAVVFFLSYTSQLFEYVKSMKVAPLKSDDSGEDLTANAKEPRREVPVRTEKQKICRKPNKRQVVVKRSADIEAEVDRLMRENGLLE